MSFSSKPTSIISFIEDADELPNITAHISTSTPEGYIANFEVVIGKAGTLLITNYIPDYNAQLDNIDQRLAQTAEVFAKFAEQV